MCVCVFLIEVWREGAMADGGLRKQERKLERWRVCKGVGPEVLWRRKSCGEHSCVGGWGGWAGRRGGEVNVYTVASRSDGAEGGDARQRQGRAGGTPMSCTVAGADGDTDTDDAHSDLVPRQTAPFTRCIIISVFLRRGRSSSSSTLINV